MPPRRAVTFRSARFSRAPDPRHAHNAPGRDLAQWLKAELTDAGYAVHREIAESKDGYVVRVAAGTHPHQVAISASGDRWLVAVDRVKGLLDALPGMGHKPVAVEVLRSLNAILNAPDVSGLGWHERPDDASGEGAPGPE